MASPDSARFRGGGSVGARRAGPRSGVPATEGVPRTEAEHCRIRRSHLAAGVGWAGRADRGPKRDPRGLALLARLRSSRRPPAPAYGRLESLASAPGPPCPPAPAYGRLESLASAPGPPCPPAPACGRLGVSLRLQPALPAHPTDAPPPRPALPPLRPHHHDDAHQTEHRVAQPGRDVRGQGAVVSQSLAGAHEAVVQE